MVAGAERSSKRDPSFEPLLAFLGTDHDPIHHWLRILRDERLVTCDHAGASRCGPLCGLCNLFAHGAAICLESGAGSAGQKIAATAGVWGRVEAGAPSRYAGRDLAPHRAD